MRDLHPDSSCVRSLISPITTPSQNAFGPVSVGFRQMARSGGADMVFAPITASSTGIEKGGNSDRPDV